MKITYFWTMPLLSLIAPICTWFLPDEFPWIPEQVTQVIAGVVILFSILPLAVSIYVLIALNIRKNENNPALMSVRVAKWFSWLIILASPVLIFLGLMTAIKVVGGFC